MKNGSTPLLAESAEDLRGLLDVVVMESASKELTVKMTECMVVSKKESPGFSLKVKYQVISQVRQVCITLMTRCSSDFFGFSLWLYSFSSPSESQRVALVKNFKAFLR